MVAGWPADRLCSRQGDPNSNLGVREDELLTKIGDDDIRDSWGSIEWSDRDGDHPDVYLDWDPKHPVLLVSTGSSTSVRLVPTTPSARDENGPDQSQRIFSGHFMAATNSAVWSRSGKWLAFAKAGDIWLASREHPASTGLESGHFQVIQSEYYDVARRLCALAFYNEDDASGSATTPFCVTELAWTKDARRLVYLKRRIGGSGYNEIGYLQFTQPGAGLSVQGEHSTAYVLHSHLVDGYRPKICPDGRTLSYILGGLYVIGWNGRHKQLIKKEVWDYDCRPE